MIPITLQDVAEIYAEMTVVTTKAKMFIGLDGIQNKSSVMLQIYFSDVAYVCTFCVVKKWMS